MVFLGLTLLLMSPIQADRLESQMRSLLEIQEGVDLRLEQRDKELCQLQSQSQANGAQLAALSLQLQELISSVESRAKVVGKDLKEINGRFDHHRGISNFTHLLITLKSAQSTLINTQSNQSMMTVQHRG